MEEKTAAELLAKNGVPDPLREARLLKHSNLPFAEAVKRRSRRCPYSRIVGRREFWSLEFQINSKTLDPRPDSELLIEMALAHCRGLGLRRPYRVLDLGCGSGCLLIALLKELPKAEGLGLDVCPEALAVAAANRRRHRLVGRINLVAGHWGRALGRKFDIIVCNPPYIASAELGRLMPEVRDYDPRLALDGGPDGQECYRQILPELSALLEKRGRCFMELGQRHEKTVNLARAAGLTIVSLGQDYGGRQRCLVLENGLS